jgi:hypothetical protein
MIVSIHQPNYLPWLGYFYKIWASDTFVLHDNVEYTKHSFTKRVFIRKTPADVERNYLTVPLKRHSDFALIRDLKICNEKNWQQKHVNKIYYVYHRAPFFNDYFSIIEQTILASSKMSFLADLNKRLILDILDFLNIEKEIVLSSNLPIDGFRADEYNAEIVACLGGDLYISGTGAKKYQFNMTYSDRGVSLIYNELSKFIKEAPPQYPVNFDPSLSILDALFYIGSEGILDIFEAYHESALHTEVAFSF